MYTCIYIQTHIHMCIYVHIYIYIYAHMYMHTCRCLYLHLHPSAFVRISSSSCVVKICRLFSRLNVIDMQWLCTYIHVCIHIYVYMYITFIVLWHRRLSSIRLSRPRPGGRLWFRPQLREKLTSRLRLHPSCCTGRSHNRRRNQSRCVSFMLQWHARIHTYIHTYPYIHTYTHMHLYIHACMHAYMHTCKHTCIQTHKHMHVYDSNMITSYVYCLVEVSLFLEAIFFRFEEYYQKAIFK